MNRGENTFLENNRSSFSWKEQVTEGAEPRWMEPLKQRWSESPNGVLNVWEAKWKINTSLLSYNEASSWRDFYSLTAHKRKWSPSWSSLPMGKVNHNSKKISGVQWSVRLIRHCLCFLSSCFCFLPALVTTSYNKTIRRLIVCTQAYLWVLDRTLRLLLRKQFLLELLVIVFL